MSLLPPRKIHTDTSVPHLRTEDTEPELAAKLSTEDRLMALLEKLAEAGHGSGLSDAQLETILTKVGITTAEGMRQSLKPPENKVHSNESAYFTTADKAKYGSFEQKPVLRRKTFFIGAEEKNERLMPAEIDAYNAITENRQARGGRWKALFKKQGFAEEELWIEVPCETVDARMDLPSLLLILHELNGGRSTENVHQLVKQIEFLKAKVVKGESMLPAELEAQLLVQ